MQYFYLFIYYYYYFQLGKVAFSYLNHIKTSSCRVSLNLMSKEKTLAAGFPFKSWLGGFCFFRLVYLLFVYSFVFNPTLSCGLLDFFPLGGSLQTQEVNVFSSNPFEDLKLVGFALQLGCSKLGAKIDFLFLARLRLVRGTWGM
jgi:hypothetical protein